MRLPHAVLVLPWVLALAAPAMAGPATAPASNPPRLIVAVSVDQLGADLFAQYRAHFKGGIARLLQGAVFPSAYQGHANTETCPGHSTLLTGARPARTGIISNYWYDPGIARADKRIYCAEDEGDPASTSSSPVVSARHLKVPTLGERMKTVWPQSRNVAVSAKDRAVVMMGGRRIDEGYWFKAGQFVTFRGAELSPSARSVNTAMAAVIAKGARAFAVPAWCAPQSRPIVVGKAGEVGTARFVLPAGDNDAFRISPRMDAATLDLAGRLVDQLGMGKGQTPDLLSVSLSATDYIGHASGNQGAEMCIQMAELDRTLGLFFNRLDRAGLDYAVVLSADHGGLDAPERMDEQAFPRAVRADPALLPASLGREIAAQLKLRIEGPLIYGGEPFGDFYLSRRLTAEQRGPVLGALLARLRAHPQVAAVFRAEELAATPMPTGNPQDWTLRERARASFDASRSGDVVVLLERAVLGITEPGKGYVAGHGSVWDYDRRVPLLFWRRGMRGFEQPAPVETVDIAPTLAAMLQLEATDGDFDGRCLDLDGGPVNTCEAPQ